MKWTAQVFAAEDFEPYRPITEKVPKGECITIFNSTHKRDPDNREGAEKGGRGQSNGTLSRDADRPVLLCAMLSWKRKST